MREKSDVENVRLASSLPEEPLQMVFGLSEFQRQLLNYLFKVAEPTSTGKLRLALVEKLVRKNSDISSNAYELQASIFFFSKVVLTAIPKLKKKGIKVPSYDLTETELAGLEKKGYIEKQDEPGKNAKYMWILKTDFIQVYQKIKQRLSNELANAREKDADIASKTKVASGAHERAFFDTYPSIVLNFFGIATNFVGPQR